MNITNINPAIERSITSQFLEICLLIFVIFLVLLTKVYEVSLLAYFISLIYCLYFFYRYVFLQNSFIENSMHWEKVKGKALNKKLIWKQWFLDRTAGYVPDILYQYTFKDKVYKSRQFSLADRYVVERDQGEAQRFLDQIFKENNITVYVNPNKPEQSYINQDVNLKGKFPIIGYLLVVVIPLVGLAYLLNL